MTTDAHDDDMPDEIDFSGGTRGKFYRPDAQLQLPIHLEANVRDTLAALANARGVVQKPIESSTTRVENITPPSAQPSSIREDVDIRYP